MRVRGAAKVARRGNTGRASRVTDPHARARRRMMSSDKSSSSGARSDALPQPQPRGAVTSMPASGPIVIIMPGGVTVTVNVQTARLPAASLAVTVTLVAPTAKVLPDAAEYVSAGVDTASVAVASA